MDSPHILVVDDNHINRLFFESALRKLTCTVVSVINGIEAIERARCEEFDLILMDIRMDGMNGIEAADHIKGIEKNKSTPIIAVSAESFAIHQYPNFCASLLKPINQDKLSQIITEYTQTKSAFNHPKALEISHQDEEIVMHLRRLFIEQLSEFEMQIKALFNEQEKNQLQDRLHQMLGSAKICAAEDIVNQIIIFKSKLKEDDVFQQKESIQPLLTAIKQAGNI